MRIIVSTVEFEVHCKIWKPWILKGFGRWNHQCKFVGQAHRNDWGSGTLETTNLVPNRPEVMKNDGLTLDKHQFYVISALWEKIFVLYESYGCRKIFSKVVLSKAVRRKNYEGIFWPSGKFSTKPTPNNEVKPLVFSLCCLRHSEEWRFIERVKKMVKKNVSREL